MQLAKTLLIAALTACTFACGYNSKNYSQTSTAGTTPMISQVNPDSTTAGGTAFTLTVNGSNFGTKATINWNGAVQATTYMSGTELTATIPAALIANAGTVQITVTNPAVSGTGQYGSGGTLAATSMPVSFSID